MKVERVVSMARRQAEYERGRAAGLLKNAREVGGLMPTPWSELERVAERLDDLVLFIEQLSDGAR